MRVELLAVTLKQVSWWSAELGKRSLNSGWGLFQMDPIGQVTDCSRKAPCRATSTRRGEVRATGLVRNSLARSLVRSLSGYISGSDVPRQRLTGKDLRRVDRTVLSVLFAKAFNPVTSKWLVGRMHACPGLYRVWIYVLAMAIREREPDQPLFDWPYSV
jgi:hypothetical protein